MSSGECNRQEDENQKNSGSGSGGKKLKKTTAAAVTPSNEVENSVARLITGNDSTPVRSPEEADGEEDYQEHGEDCKGN